MRSIRCIATVCSLIGLIIVAALIYCEYSKNQLVSHISKLPASQNAFDYIAKNQLNSPLITHKKQQALVHHTLKQFFQPWNQPTLSFTTDRADLRLLIKSYRANPQYNYNQQKHSLAWINDVIKNMNVQATPWKYKLGIALRATTLRNLPTDLPTYYDSRIAGQGYPFDNAQSSTLRPGEPITILQQSRDHAWSYVVDHNSDGWVRSNAIAPVSRAFANRYQHHQLIVITRDQTPILDSNGHFLYYGYIGTLLPQKNHHVLAPKQISDQQVTLTNASVNKNSFQPFPLLATPKNVATLMNRMMGEPYAWGGLYGMRDCSLTTQELMLPFGILLPRISRDQATVGHPISFKGLSNQQKIANIIKHGIPFFTLIHLHNHIVLYIGTQDDTPMIFQNKWGIKTKDILGHEGRAVIGRADILPITFGDEVQHSAENFTTESSDMTVLTKMSSVAKL